MDGDKVRVSIVCPAYQEEDVLPIFHLELTAVLETLESEYVFEIIYVDDGSSDGTLPVLREMARSDSRIRYRSLSRNFGHQAALTAGLDIARGDVVISMDSDLQHPPALIPTLLRKYRTGYDVVLTIRGEDERLGWFKRASSRLFYRVMNRLSDVDIRAAASDFRLLSRRAVRALGQMRERHRFLRGMVQWLGFPTTEVQFAPDERRAGVSKYTFTKMLNLAKDGLFSFSRLPLKLSSYVGLACLVLGVLHSTGLLAQSLWGSSGGSTSAYLVLAAHLLGASVLFGLGVLGEYVGRIYEETKGRPLYLVKDESPRRRAKGKRRRLRVDSRYDMASQ